VVDSGLTTQGLSRCRAREVLGSWLRRCVWSGRPQARVRRPI